MMLSSNTILSSHYYLIPFSIIMIAISLLSIPCRSALQPISKVTFSRATLSPSKLMMSSSFSTTSQEKGTILVLGGTGYLGQNVCREAIKDGYSVVSLSRRGLPSLEGIDDEDKQYLSPSSGYVDYCQGDATQKIAITNIMNVNDKKIVGIVHCIGLLFDDASGLGSFNKLVSGSGSVPDSEGTYDRITRMTAFNAIDAAIDYATTQQPNGKPLPFIFTSAAEAGWPQMTGGPFIESIMPEFIGRYMVAKRAVESKLMNESQPTLRPVIVRPSLIYTPKQLASIPPVAAFTFANAIGVPFVDRPVTVSSLSKAIVKSINDDSIVGIQRYTEIDKLGM